MTLVAIASALRAELGAELGISTELNAASTIATACEIMGIMPETGETLPQLAARVAAAVGVEIPGTAHASASTSTPPKPAQAKAAPTSAAPVPAATASRRKQAVTSGKTPSKQVDIREMGLKKFLVPKSIAEKVAARAHARGEQLTQDELEQQAGSEVKELPSEKLQVDEAPVALYACRFCSKTCTNAGALRSHEIWAHPSQPRTALEVQARPFQGSVSAALNLVGGAVKVILLINGKDRAQLKREEAEALREWEAGKVAREAEQYRRRVATQAQREREAAVDQREQRRGAAHRHCYTPAEKLRLIHLLDDVYANPLVLNKSGAFEEDRRSRGAPFSTAVKWLKPQVRREISRAAAQDGAKKLLRIDKNSRKVGKYVPMEKELFRLFRLRRSKARKTSTKYAAAHGCVAR